MRKLTVKDSNKKVSEHSNRHKRLSYQNINGSKYGTSIEEPLDKFDLKLSEQKSLEDNLQSASDLMHLNSLKISDNLRTLSERSHEYDRKNPGQKVTGFLFPDGILTPLLRLSPYKKLDALADILRKLQSLGETNGLFTLNTELKASYDALAEAIAGEKKAEDDVKDGETLLLQAKIILVKQYNDNYHKAVIDYGKNYAEMLFPVIKTKSKKETPTTEVPDSKISE